MRFSTIRKIATMTSTTTTTTTMNATKKASLASVALRINGARLMESIHSTCEFGKAHPYGE